MVAPGSGTIVEIPSVRTAVARLTTVALATAAAYLAVVVLLATGEAIGYRTAMERQRSSCWSEAPFSAGAAAVTWFARRDRHSWWRAVRRASLVLILGTDAAGLIYMLANGPF